MVESGERYGRLKNAVQARAAVYDETVDPIWFKKGRDISKKVKALHDRTMIRSQLVGAPFLVARTGLTAVRWNLVAAYPGICGSIRLGDRIMVPEMLKILGSTPPWAVLKLL